MPIRLREKNVVPMGRDFKDYEREVDRLKAGIVSNYFSPDEIREIMTSIHSALWRLGEQGLVSRVSLMRDMTMKLEELTQIIISKSGWDRRFKAEAFRKNLPTVSRWSRGKSS